MIGLDYNRDEWTADGLAAFAASVDRDMPVDLGIVRAVKVLRDAGFRTIESCEGGDGHSYPEPTVKFATSSAGGWQALGHLLDWGLPVRRIGQMWTMTEGLPVGPDWIVTFYRKLD